MTDPTQKSLFQLSYPLFLNSMVMLAVMVVDTMIFSADSAETAAALSVARPVLVVSFELSTMIGIGGMILISNCLGAGDQAGAARAAEVAVLANAGLGVCIGMATALAGPFVIGLMSVPGPITGDAVIYLYLVSAAMMFHGFGNAAVSVLRGYGASRTVLVLGGVGGALYLVLEYLLILGAGPVPGMGVTGSGLATLILRSVVAVPLALLLARRFGLRLNPCRLAGQGTQVRRMLNLSFPSVSDYIAYGVYQVVLLGLVTPFGLVAVLSRAYVMIALNFLNFLVMAISQGNEVMIGYRRGAGAMEQAGRLAWRAAVWAALWATGGAVAVFLAAGPFIGLFTQDPEVHRLSRELLLLSILIQPGIACNMILFHALRAIGDTRWPVVTGQALTWGISLPLAWYLCVHSGLGVAGVWYAMIVEETLKGAVMAWRWRQMSGGARMAGTRV